ncbi:SDR family oxidoreductase [Massilia sp. PWRC2]|uniref:SDR family oxidoreductase n=1 Tax=Massilia sp. PWRC2 TaxID=2804626 RepID=UPI003CF43F39
MQVIVITGGSRVNAVSPGAIRTELGGGLNAAFETMLAGQTALGRVGEPDVVGRVIATLLSTDTAWVNAQTIEVGGGYLIECNRPVCCRRGHPSFRKIFHDFHHPHLWRHRLHRHTGRHAGARQPAGVRDCRPQRCASC